MADFSEWYSENKARLSTMSEIQRLERCWSDCETVYQGHVRILVHVLKAAKDKMAKQDVEEFDRIIEDAIQMVEGKH